MSKFTRLHTPIDNVSENIFDPWMIFPSGDIGSASVKTPENIVLYAGSVRGKNLGKAMANARLIASAPELLEALEECVRELAAHETICEVIRQDKMPHTKPFQPSEAMNKAKKALKKVYTV